MVYGDGIAYVEPETAGQMICGALSPEEWRRAFGDVPAVGRTVYGDPTSGTCVVASGSLQVKLSMMRLALTSAGGTEAIAGHRVRFGTSSSNRIASVDAAIVPVGEQDIPAQQRVNANPTLHVLADEKDFDAHADLPALLRRLLAVLLPKLTTNGPPTPVEQIPQRLAFAPTEPIAGVAIYDLPGTVQSLVLCTIAQRASGITAPPDAILVNSVSECSISRPIRMLVKVDRFLPAVQQQFPIAGHAAQISDVGVQIDLLSMTNEYERETHVALRLDRRDLDQKPDRLRAWAEKVAGPLVPPA